MDKEGIRRLLSPELGLVALLTRFAGDFRQMGIAEVDEDSTGWGGPCVEAF